MKIAAFCQLYNEREKGHLSRFLNNVRLWADDLFIYDDASTDGSQDLYRHYTKPANVIHGKENNFKRELFHKQELLELTLKSNPDWIIWLDGDAIFESRIVRRLRDLLDNAEKGGLELIAFRNMNLWRSESYYRVDEYFYGYWPECCWRNTGKLKYDPVEQLHQSQQPGGIDARKSERFPLNIIHYGFSSEECIVRKYLTYKALGQKGWELDRLIDEQTSFQVVKVPVELYPSGCRPADHAIAKPPTPITYNEYRGLNSCEELCRLRAR